MSLYKKFVHDIFLVLLKRKTTTTPTREQTTANSKNAMATMTKKTVTRKEALGITEEQVSGHAVVSIRIESLYP